MNVSDQDERVAVSMQQLALASSMTLAPLVELLQEEGIVTRQGALEPVREIHGRRSSLGGRG